MDRFGLKEKILSFTTNKINLIITAIFFAIIFAFILIVITISAVKTQETSSEFEQSIDIANVESGIKSDVQENTWKIDLNEENINQKETQNQEQLQVQNDVQNQEQSQVQNDVQNQEQSQVQNDVQNQEQLPNQGQSEQTNTGVIYLTFDDGPTTSSTPKILDILKEENVKATFFILNFNENGEEIVKREVAEGHTVGIHGYSHEYEDIYKSDEAYMENLNKLQNKILQVTGVKTVVTRFPGGSSNTRSKKYNKKIMTRLVKEVEKAGYKYYDWNVDSEDAGGAKNKKAIYNNVTKNLKPNRSNVVLMHDFAKNDKTIDALKNIIKFGKENGYTFSAINAESDLVCHHTVNN